MFFGTTPWLVTNFPQPKAKNTRKGIWRQNMCVANDPQPTWPQILKGQEYMGEFIKQHTFPSRQWGTITKQ